MTLFILLLASFPKEVRRLNIYAFSFAFVLSPTTLDCLVAGVSEPSGMEPKVR